MSRRVVRLSSGLVLFTYKTHAAPYTFEHRHPQIGFEQQDTGQSSLPRGGARKLILDWCAWPAKVSSQPSRETQVAGHECAFSNIQRRTASGGVRRHLLRSSELVT